VEVEGRRGRKDAGTWIEKNKEVPRARRRRRWEEV